MKLLTALLSLFIVSNVHSAQMKIESANLPKYIRAVLEAKSYADYECEIYGGMIGDNFLNHVNEGYINSDRSIVLKYEGRQTTSQTIDFTLTLSEDSKIIEKIKIDIYNYRTVNVGDILNPDFQERRFVSGSDTCVIKK